MSDPNDAIRQARRILPPSLPRDFASSVIRRIQQEWRPGLLALIAVAGLGTVAALVTSVFNNKQADREPPPFPAVSSDAPFSRQP